MSRHPWDLVVVGGGTAGLVAAYAGAAVGARVALVERERTGGDCLWTGCVPSKSLLHAASTVAAARRAERFVEPSARRGEPGRADLAAVMGHVREAIATIEPVDSPAALKEAGVAVLSGDATFLGDGTVSVDGTPHAYWRAMVATGAAPRLPDIPGLAECGPLTTDTVWSLDALPDRMLVIGGGPVGCELGQAFARLGTAVTLVEAGPRLLPREDPAAAAVVAEALRADGVDLRLDGQVERVTPAPARGVEAQIVDGEGARRVSVDAVLVAVGRTPRTSGLRLDRVGVATTADGAVQVDRYGRTSNPAVYAAGDVTQHLNLTHLAAAHAAAATANALLGLRRTVDLAAVPRVTYTDPEVAAVGMRTWRADSSGAGRGADDEPRRVLTRHHDHVDRAIADDRTAGFSRLAVDARTRVVGATIVGPRAGESIAEMVLAVRTGTTITGLADTVHAYPTYADGPWNAAVDEVRRRLAHPVVQRATRSIIAARRRGGRRSA